MDVPFLFFASCFTPKALNSTAQGNSAKPSYPGLTSPSNAPTLKGLHRTLSGKLSGMNFGGCRKNTMSSTIRVMSGIDRTVVPFQGNGTSARNPSLRRVSRAIHAGAPSSTLAMNVCVFACVVPDDQDDSRRGEPPRSSAVHHTKLPPRLSSSLPG